ncbi:hypothetical protein Clacol_003050 [Clathrus columnatus]|uniref:non-specific serine/threonine protein kinase n=1 Tax=Clathrus columnatus TaxID=1419009 RepID=A0AAV5A746_9AGAM|nr:hypothetical protein Clacol_003050 [Clathrus columnatus]
MTLKTPELGSDFYYNIPETTEGIIRYLPGGYHPAIIGDILGESPQRKYRLMHKLGWVSSATVWLAQTTDETEAFVSVKITTADGDNDAQFLQQIEILQKTTKTQPDSSSSHIQTLLDHFKLHGPNGIHTVIVTEVVVPILPLLSKKPPAWRKAAAYGLVKGMVQLHANRIVHGDWHLGSIGIAMPQLANQDPTDVMLELSPHDATIVLTRTPSDQTSSLPAYLLSPCDLAAYYQMIASQDPPQMKVCDFSSGALETCAPETVFTRVFERIDNPALSPPADIWALGIYQIITDSALFYNMGMRDLPFHMSRIAGRIPPQWEKWSASLFDYNIAQIDTEEWWDSHWKTLREGCENDEDTAALVQLLRAVLVLDPKERPTAAQIANDPWFQSVSVENITLT